MVDPTGTSVLFSPSEDARVIHALPVEGIDTATPELIGRHERDIWSCDFDVVNRAVACGDFAGEIRFWPLARGQEYNYRKVVQWPTPGKPGSEMGRFTLPEKYGQIYPE